MAVAHQKSGMSGFRVFSISAAGSATIRQGAQGSRNGSVFVCGCERMCCGVLCVSLSAQAGFRTSADVLHVHLRTLGQLMFGGV